jgi:ATP-binding cassette subfamily B protein
VSDGARRIGAAIALAWRADRRVLSGYAAATLAAGVLPVAVAWATKVVVDRLAAGAAPGAVLAAGAALAGAGLGLAVLPPLLRYLQGELGRAVAVRSKDTLYRAVDRLELLRTLESPAFRDRLRLAEQASRSGPGQVVDSALGSAQAAVTLAGLVTAVAVIMPAAAAVLLASAGPALVAEVRLSRRRAAMLAEISPGERRELFYTELLTSLSAAKEIRLFGAGLLFRRRMLTELGAANAERRRLDRRELAVQGLLAAAAAGLAGAILIWVFAAAAEGRLSVGDVAAVIAAIAGSQGALAALVDHLATGHHAGLLFAHYRALVDTADPEVRGTPGPQPATPAPARPPGGTGIELVDVWFRYADGQPWALRGVSVRIDTGASVALVGENGSGKSTLVKLLCRFYDPTRGAIRWDGVDLRDIPVAELRGRIGAVFQDFMCYELEAAENIALGDVDGADRLDLAPDRIIEAARRADVHATLERLPQGYRTLLSRTFVDYAGDDTGGVLLSGGQWQRLALARALLRGHRRLLLLDEPSSGLDAAAEHRIHHQIAAQRGGSTVVLVSHRLNTVRDADRILVLADGRLVEQGGHAELLAAGGTYARLFRLQASGYLPAGAPP